MPSRFQNKQREWVYLFLSVRDGDHCLICNVKPSPRRKLEIDHADGNPGNSQPQNLHLLCRKCNQAMRLKTSKEHSRIIANHYAKNVCESVRENIDASKRILEYESGSSEMKANSFYEGKFRDWIIDQMERLGSIPRREAINSGAELVGCSPITITRYLDKLTSFQGILEVHKEANQTIITRRINKK